MDELTLLTFEFGPGLAPLPNPDARERVVRWLPERALRRAWKHLRWPPFDWFAGPAHVYHFTNFVLPPLSRGRSVVTIYDVSFLRNAESIEPKNLEFLKAEVPRAAKGADAILTISEFVAGEIAASLGVGPERLFAVHPGLNHGLIRPEAARIAAMRAALGLARPYLLFVGTLEPRKNLPFLIDLFDALDWFEGDLVIAGALGWKHGPILAKMKSARRARDIHYVRYIEDDALAALYAGAELFLFPSFYEGFGFPPLEAMACGTSVVSSAGGSLPEVLGDASVIVPDFDIDAWSNAARILLHDSEERSRRIHRGLARASCYTWEIAAEKTWNVYRKVAE